MKKQKMYRYLGRNGILTTMILLDGISYIPMVQLTASAGRLLTNGEKHVRTVVVEESEVDNWYEITDKTVE